MAAKKKTARKETTRRKTDGPGRRSATGRKKLAGKLTRRPPPSVRADAASTKPQRAKGSPEPPVFTVVGIGASAGGLDAFKGFFTAVPNDTDMVFVLVQHLDPTHVSLTAELLGKQTAMPVVQVTDEVQVEPNHVYVIPPNRYLTISGQRLHLTEPIERRGVRVPIDFFFRSLANEQQERAIGIILSGTGTDGTLGVREIKAAGGMVMVQTPETAQFDGMPSSAIGTGVVDYVLPIEKMPAALIRYVRHWYVNGAVSPPPVDETAPDHLVTIVDLLRARLKCDFSCYKKGTLTRRVQRRMGLKHIEDIGEYVELLRRQKTEVDALYKDLLIGVTNFFREPQSWRFLEESVIAPLVHEHEWDEALRVWVPGCATGEEAYSLAMVLGEQLQAADKMCDIQIFASDIDQDALAFARAGIYPESVAADIPPERLRQFFTKGEHTYRINRRIRDAVVFAQQNLISDPPFSKLDLISCRNLLIYLEKEIQQRIFSLFHFALREGGYVFLGNSEMINEQEDLFTTVSRKHRIYRRIGPARHDKLELPVLAAGRQRATSEVPAEANEPAGRGLAALAHHLLVQRFALACALINRKAEVLYLDGPVDRYLQLPTGNLRPDLIAMARDGLRTRLRSAVNQALRDDRPVHVTDVRVQRDRKYHPIRLAVEPLRQPKEAEGLLLVVFEDEGAETGVWPVTTEPGEPSIAAAAEGPGDFETIVRQLEDELRTTREDLQSTIEELETANEEFKAANEEVTSINEELQSTNEELETSKQELQSLNEELQTLNNQLEQKVGELESTNDDLTNLLTSTDMATIFLDRHFRLRRFTPAATRLLPVLETDMGRPITDFATNFRDQDLLDDALVVLQRLMPVEKEIQSGEGRCYLRQILPYRTEDDRIDGVVITFTDISARKAAEERLQTLYEQLEQQVTERTSELHLAQTVLQNTAAAVAILEPNGTILSWNRGAEKLFGYTGEEAVGENILMLAAADRTHEFGHLKGRVEQEQSVPEYDTVRLDKSGNPIPVCLAVSLVETDKGHRFCWIAHDIRRRKQLEQTIAELVDSERLAFGRELHDTLGQYVTAIGLIGCSLRKKLAGDPSMKEVIAKLEQSVERARSYIRDLAKGLSPVDIDVYGLIGALEGLVYETQQTHKVECVFEYERVVPIENNFLATQLYLIVREAIHNAVRHGHPHRIVVRLHNDDGLRLSIQDDGAGIPSEAEGEPGMGLHIMRYRCGAIGGHLTVVPAEGGGTIVTCSVPATE